MSPSYSSGAESLSLRDCPVFAQVASVTGPAPSRPRLPPPARALAALPRSRRGTAWEAQSEAETTTTALAPSESKTIVHPLSEHPLNHFGSDRNRPLVATVHKSA